VIRFVDGNRERFGVEPVCRVLKEHSVEIAPRTYWAAKSRAPSVRSVRDGELKPLIDAVFHDRAATARSAPRGPTTRPRGPRTW
jgi:putative transposase